MCLIYSKVLERCMEVYNICARLNKSSTINGAGLQIDIAITNMNVQQYYKDQLATLERTSRDKWHKWDFLPL